MSRPGPKGTNRSTRREVRPAPRPDASLALRLAALFAQALPLHQVGRIAEAEAIYRKILEEDPAHFDARHMLGVVHLQRGEHIAALRNIEAALKTKPGVAAAHNNRGTALAALRRLDEAADCYDRAVALAPDYVDALTNRGNTLKDLGRSDAALACYDKALAISPHHAVALVKRGNVLQELRRYEEAVASYDQAVAINPDLSEAWHNRGVALARLGRLADAVASYDRAIALRPHDAAACGHRGIALAGLGRFDAALASYDRAIAFDPGNGGMFGHRGQALVELGRLEDALASYDRALSIKPDDADALNDRAVVLCWLGRFDAALDSCDRSIELKPGNAEAFNNRGNALSGLTRFDEALASFDAAIGLKPDLADAHSNRGTALRQLRRSDEAIASCERAVALRPDKAEYHNNLAIALAEVKRFDAAVLGYGRAVALKPDYADAWNNLGFAYRSLNRPADALASYARAVALEPDMHYLAGTHLYAKMHVCDWSDFDGSCARLRAAVAEGRAAAMGFHLLAIPADGELQLRCAAIYAADRVRASGAPLWRGERYGHRRIRLAYLSSDLRDHPVAMLAAGLFARHDRSRFETVAISFKQDPQSQLQARLRASFDRFVDASTMSDRDVAALLRALEIDIAIDLNGYTEGARSDVLAHRAAPVQVNYLGYAGTLGQPTWDYVLADRFVIPEENRAFFAENVVYLPDCFMVTDCGREISPARPTRAEAALPERGLVFCCFNNSFKITPDVFAVWMRLLDRFDDSVLWLSATNAAAIANLRQEAERRGIAPDRLVFAPRLPSSEDYLARLRLADLFLDTLYYNAHATAVDALWAGVPVLTCAGPTFAGRVAGSLLHAIGLPELIAGSVADYEALAVALASDRGRLAAVRAALARNRDVHPLFDTDRFTRAIEAAYVTMWQRAERGEPPQGFAVVGA
jgi:predicted O-linked N-acetylglucosamine transferase (SPINDLY family)